MADVARVFYARTDAGLFGPFATEQLAEEAMNDSPSWQLVRVSTWPCSCDNTVERWPGEGDVTCERCGAEYNACGQRLRDNWRMNPSGHDDDIDDLSGCELAALREDGER